MLLRLCAFALAALFFTAAHAESDTDPQDLLAFSSGALIDRTSPSFGSGWKPLWLLDEDVQTGWANEEGSKPPFEIVISLPEQSRLTSFGFDTAAAESGERSARDVDILVSDQSATAGFIKVMSVVLEPAADGQRFNTPAPAVGRWVKFVIRTNHGDDRYWEIMNVHGFGTALTRTPLANVSGTYDSAAYGKFHLAQTGNQLSGCYEYQGGLVQGGLEDHLMRLTWSENQGGNKGPAVMVQTRDGTGFQGLWRNEGDSGWNDNWTLKKISATIGSCPHWAPPAAGKPNTPASGGNLIAEGLRREGRARLYGITFDTDSDKLRPEASATLDQLAMALKSNAAWTLAIEGHTDSTSTPAHNQDLSARRATAVKTYLVAAGIQASRLQTQGFGQDRPVAPNDTSLGRAQNRRVEVVRE